MGWKLYQSSIMQLHHLHCESKLQIAFSLFWDITGIKLGLLRCHTVCFYMVNLQRFFSCLRKLYLWCNLHYATETIPKMHSCIQYRVYWILHYQWKYTYFFHVLFGMFSITLLNRVHKDNSFMTKLFSNGRSKINIIHSVQICRWLKPED